MAIPLRIIEKPGLDVSWANGVPDGAQPGDMWPYEYEDDGERGWAIVLPNGAGMWCTTWPSFVRGSSQLGPRWTVTGEAPNLTVSPSIDAGVWHGWIRNGQLVDA